MDNLNTIAFNKSYVVLLSNIDRVMEEITNSPPDHKFLLIFNTFVYTKKPYEIHHTVEIHVSHYFYIPNDMRFYNIEKWVALSENGMYFTQYVSYIKHADMNVICFDQLGDVREFGNVLTDASYSRMETVTLNICYAGAHMVFNVGSLSRRYPNAKFIINGVQPLVTITNSYHKTVNVETNVPYGMIYVKGGDINLHNKGYGSVVISNGTVVTDYSIRVYHNIKASQFDAVVAQYQHAVKQVAMAGLRNYDKLLFACNRYLYRYVETYLKSKKHLAYHMIPPQPDYNKMMMNLFDDDCAE